MNFVSRKGAEAQRGFKDVLIYSLVVITFKIIHFVHPTLFCR